MAAAIRAFQLVDLIREWRLRLAALRTSLSETHGSDRWLGEIRLRILRFLVSRYAEQRDRQQSEHRESAPAYGLDNSRFDLPDITPEYAGPRTTKQLRPLLLDIRRQRQSKPRWRFWP